MVNNIEIMYSKGSSSLIMDFGQAIKTFTKLRAASNRNHIIDITADQYLYDVGLRMELYRNEYGLTQEEVAGSMNISQSKVSMIEHAETDVSLRELFELKNNIPYYDMFGLLGREMYYNDPLNSKYAYLRSKLNNTGINMMMYLFISLESNLELFRKESR